MMSKHPKNVMKIVLGTEVQCPTPSTFEEFKAQVTRPVEGLREVQVSQFVIDCPYQKDGPGSCGSDCEHCGGTNQTVIWLAYRPKAEAKAKAG